MKMALTYKDDLFMLQIRLFRLAQIRWQMTPVECEEVFEKNNVNAYIETCYEDYHVQGDEADLMDIDNYLHEKGWRKWKENISW